MGQSLNSFLARRKKSSVEPPEEATEMVEEYLRTIAELRAQRKSVAKWTLSTGQQGLELLQGHAKLLDERAQELKDIKADLQTQGGQAKAEAAAKVLEDRKVRNQAISGFDRTIPASLQKWLYSVGQLASGALGQVPHPVWGARLPAGRRRRSAEDPRPLHHA